MHSSTNEQTKAFKGRITNVRKDQFSSRSGRSYRRDIYGPNLGYLFRCDFLDHPRFGFSRGGHTSLVVSYDKATGDLETLNSRYKVV